MIFFALLLTAMPVLAVSSSLSGTWVPSSIKQALEIGQARELPCWVEVEAGAEPRVMEDCGGERQEWTDVAVAVQRAGTVEVEGRVREGERRLVLRAGAPNELERIAASPTEGGQRQMQRLYRLPTGAEHRLAGWSAAQRLLVHPFRTDDGAAVEFRADGSYRFAEEEGRYELQPWPLVEGAAGLLLLDAKEGPKRRYWVVGEGDRLGLAPAQQPWELEKLQQRQSEALERIAAGAAAEDAAEGNVAEGIAAEPGHSLPHAATGDAVVPPVEGDTSQRQLDAMIERLVAAPSVEASPDEPARPTAIFVVDAEAASIWLSRNEVPLEPVAIPEEVGGGDGLEEEAEIPAIARPIEPRRRGCGCNAAEGVGFLALLPLAGLLSHSRFSPWRRKAQGVAKDSGETQSPR